MNLQKLAQLANVSVSTVSKAFSDSKEISAETKKQIFEIAREHGCFEKYYKPRYGKKLIAVICPEILGIHYTQMMTYIEREVQSYGGTMLFSVCNFSAKEQNDLLEYYLKFAHADGVIVIEPAGKIRNNTDVPIVQIGRENESKDADCVDVDIVPAMEEAFRELARLGHKSIGFIGEKLAEKEYRYFEQIAEKRRIAVRPEHVIISDKRFYDAGYSAAEELLRSKELPTAIFAAYSHIATGFLQKMKEEGVRVPEELSLICMDDIVTTPYPERETSCIRMHLDELCAVAIDLLFQKLDNRFLTTKRVISVTREFVRGETIAERKKS